MPDQFRDLRDHYGRILQELFPYDALTAGTMCTLAADALDDYLRTGRIVPVEDMLVNEYRTSGTMHVATLRMIVLKVLQRGHGNWAVVQGTRPRPSGSVIGHLTQTHWFVVFNADGVAYIADAYAHAVHGDSQRYADEQGLQTFAYNGSWEANQFEAEAAMVF